MMYPIGWWGWHSFQELARGLNLFTYGGGNTKVEWRNTKAMLLPARTPFMTFPVSRLSE